MQRCILLSILQSCYQWAASLNGISSFIFRHWHGKFTNVWKESTEYRGVLTNSALSGHKLKLLFKSRRSASESGRTSGTDETASKMATSHWKESVHKWLNSQSKTCHCNIIRKRVNSWTKSNENGGDYTWKQNPNTERFFGQHLKQAFLLFLSNCV